MLGTALDTAFITARNTALTGMRNTIVQEWVANSVSRAVRSGQHD